MQFQVQKTITKRDAQQDLDNLDLFVGLHSPLTDPFNIFLRVADIKQGKELIYFYAYSIGKKKVVFWGVYDQSTDEFLVDNSCVFKLGDLSKMIDNWKKHHYEFYFSSVRNRRDRRIHQFSIYDDRISKLHLLDEFKKIYIQKLINEGIISGKSVPIDQEEYNKLMSDVGIAGLNAVSNSDYNPTIELILDEIDTKEDETPIRNFIENLRKIPKKSIRNNLSSLSNYQRNVLNHLLIHLFLMVFLDVDEYRVAKYIKFLQSDNQINDKSRVKKYIKGNFLYEWIIELAKILRIYDIDSFMYKVSNDILRIIEDKINMSTVGVIGGPLLSPNLNTLMENISSVFQNFVSKSEFTKISYTKNLKICPSSDECMMNNIEGCELYRHGDDIGSKYDFT
uniref:Uncharacterized protein n=1 Tax=Pithovirus LCPAC302 TaxID=2506593 RepID=A0A481Z8G9_9VIRU|nr:MAG: uncharacterized protein LCPAC302_00600 [Pithovirus LCPAC302]